MLVSFSLIILSSGNRLTPLLIRNRSDKINVKFSNIYLDCDHNETVDLSLVKGEWRRIKKNLLNEGWEMQEPSQEQVKLVLSVSGLCRICKKQEFIGIYQDNIGVYAGRPGNPGPLKEVIQVKVWNLPETEVEDLQAGIICYNEKEKLLILEGYQN